MKTLIILLILLLSGCNTKNDTIIEPVKLNCSSIVSMQYEDIKLEDYCQIPNDSTISLDSDFNTQDIGIHTLSYILSSNNKNDFSIGTIEYEITKYIPNCPENSSVVEDEEGNVYCACNEDYVDRTPDEDKDDTEKLVCELKAVCEVGYTYQESTNTCIKKQTAPVSNTPSASSTPSPAPSDNPSPGTSSGSGNSPAPSVTPTPSPQPTPAPQPEPSSSGSQTCSPNGNSQSALDNAYSQCVSVCNAHGNCSVYWNGSAYVAEWN